MQCKMKFDEIFRLHMQCKKVENLTAPLAGEEEHKGTAGSSNTHCVHHLRPGVESSQRRAALEKSAGEYTVDGRAPKTINNPDWKGGHNL